MSDLYDKIISQRGGFENLVAKIPGFRGYLDNKARRSADRLVRDHIADEYAARIDRFSDIEKTMAIPSALDDFNLPDLDKKKP